MSELTNTDSAWTSGTVRIVLVAVMVILLIRTVVVYRNVAGVYEHVRKLTPDSYFQVKGMLKAAEYVKVSGVRKVALFREARNEYPLQRWQENDYLFERMTELLYPVRVVAHDSPEKTAGVLMIWPAERPVPEGVETVATYGDLIVARCQR